MLKKIRKASCHDFGLIGKNRLLFRVVLFGSDKKATMEKNMETITLWGYIGIIWDILGLYWDNGIKWKLLLAKKRFLKTIRLQFVLLLRRLAHAWPLMSRSQGPKP